MRTLLATIALVFAGLVLFEVMMQPSSSERLGVGFVFGLMAFGTIAASLGVPRLARRARSIRHTIVGLTVVSFGIVAVGLAVAGEQMFLSAHDLSLLVLLTGSGLIAALAFGLMVSRPLGTDVERLALTARSISHGDLDVRSGVERIDEIGALARSIDEMAEQLEQATRQRLMDDEARRQFFTAVGHDLRTPLTSLRAAVEAAQDGLIADPDRLLRAMDREISFLSRLVDDLFLLARIESGDPNIERATVDLAEIADDAAESLQPLASQSQVRVRLESPGSVFASGGADEMVRVLRNLVENAISHSPRGGEVVISVSDGEVAMVTVTDDGPGFPGGFVDQAFDRFTRGDSTRGRANGGSGLGLAIARAYVSAFDGTITAETGPPGRISFTLPHPSIESVRE